MTAEDPNPEHPNRTVKSRLAISDACSSKKYLQKSTIPVTVADLFLAPQHTAAFPQLPLALPS